MLERAISGAVFVAIVLASIFFGPFTLWILMGVVMIGCLWEFHKLLFSRAESHFELRRVNLIGSALVIFGLFGFRFLCAYGKFDLSTTPPSLTLILGIVLLIVWLIFLSELFQKSEQPFPQIGLYLLGLVYVVVPILLYLDFTTYPRTPGHPYQPMKALAPFLLIWINDTMAYLSGRLLGKTPFFPRISPKKTWEGTIGGILFTLLISWLLSQYYFEFSAIEWMGIALMVSVFGTLGDLVESMLKRSTGVKDSGNIMPGHGGFLDRFDSFIFALPFIWVTLLLIEVWPY